MTDINAITQTRLTLKQNRILMEAELDQIKLKEAQIGGFLEGYATRQHDESVESGPCCINPDEIKNKPAA